jgi:hypothetical protein
MKYISEVRLSPVLSLYPLSNLPSFINPSLFILPFFLHILLSTFVLKVRLEDPDYEANLLLVNSYAMNGVIEESGCLARAVSFAAVLHITRYTYLPVSLSLPPFPILHPLSFLLSLSPLSLICITLRFEIQLELAFHACAFWRALMKYTSEVRISPLLSFSPLSTLPSFITPSVYYTPFIYTSYSPFF